MNPPCHTGLGARAQAWNRPWLLPWPHTARRSRGFVLYLPSDRPWLSTPPLRLAPCGRPTWMSPPQKRSANLKDSTRVRTGSQRRCGDGLEAPPTCVGLLNNPQAALKNFTFTELRNQACVASPNPSIRFRVLRENSNPFHFTMLCNYFSYRRALNVGKPITIGRRIVPASGVCPDFFLLTPEFHSTRHIRTEIILLYK